MTTPDRNETIVKTDSRIHTATDTQYRYTLHVPKFLNDGTPVDDAFVAFIEEHLLRLYGAFTRLGCSGAWIDDGTRYNDKQAVYVVDTADGTGNAIREFAVRVRDLLKQECVYVTRQSIDTWLV